MAQQLLEEELFLEPLPSEFLQEELFPQPLPTEQIKIWRYQGR